MSVNVPPRSIQNCQRAVAVHARPATVRASRVAAAADVARDGMPGAVTPTPRVRRHVACIRDRSSRNLVMSRSAAAVAARTVAASAACRCSRGRSPTSAVAAQRVGRGVARARRRRRRRLVAIAAGGSASDIAALDRRSRAPPTRRADRAAPSAAASAVTMPTTWPRQRRLQRRRTAGSRSTPAAASASLRAPAGTRDQEAAARRDAAAPASIELRRPASMKRREQTRYRRRCHDPARRGRRGPPHGGRETRSNVAAVPMSPSSGDVARREHQHVDARGACAQHWRSTCGALRAMRARGLVVEAATSCASGAPARRCRRCVRRRGSCDQAGLAHARGTSATAASPRRRSGCRRPPCRRFSACAQLGGDAASSASTPTTCGVLVRSARSRCRRASCCARGGDVMQHQHVGDRQVGAAGRGHARGRPRDRPRENAVRRRTIRPNFAQHPRRLDDCSATPGATTRRCRAATWSHAVRTLGAIVLECANMPPYLDACVATT